MKSIGRLAFTSCHSLSVIYAPGSRLPCTKIGFDTPVLVGPPKLQKIGNELLWDLRRVKEVIIPDGVNEIGERWFANSEIEVVKLPAYVRSIYTEAFQDCKRLRKL